jgi:uncharacterized surface protein with fasciclin (FAS1) repeats
MQSINRRFVLASGAAATFGALAGGARAQSRNVIDTLAGEARFSRFVELASRAGAVDQFRSASAITVFVPDNAAFARASQTRLDELLNQGSSGGGSGGAVATGTPDFARLRSLIGYHVIPGVTLSPSQLAGDHQYKTFSGGMLRVDAHGNQFAVSNPAPEQQRATLGAGGLNIVPPAAVEGQPIMASNGIIYPISQVLFP